jgi:hypothetical protein
LTRSVGKFGNDLNTKVSVLEHFGRGRMIFALLLMAQFQFWDGMMTQVFVNGGIVKEANKFAAPFIASGDFLFLKLVGTAVLLLALWLIFKRFPRMALSAASCVALFYLSIVTWNFIVLFSGPI